MGLFSKFKKILSKKEEIKNNEDVKVYDEGLKKTRDNFISKLNILGIKYTKVSEEATYEHTVTEAVTLTANFTGTITEYVLNGDFEKYFKTARNEAPGTYNSANYGWSAGLNGYDYPVNKTIENAAKDGALGLSIGTTPWNASHGTSFKTAVTPGLTYKVSFDAKLGIKHDGNASTGAMPIRIYNHNNLTGNSYKSGTNLATFTPSLTSEWTNITKVVKADSDKDVLEIDFADALAGIYIDNLSIKAVDMFEVTAPTTSLEGITSSFGGTAAADKAAVEAGEVVTYTATPTANTEFEGWYVEGAKVSSEASYAVTAQKDYKITANFVYKTGAEYVVNGDFEKGFTVETGLAEYSESTYGWGANVKASHGVNGTQRTTTAAAHNGTQSYLLGTLWNNKVTYQAIVPAGKTVEVSFWAKKAADSTPDCTITNITELGTGTIKNGTNLGKLSWNLTDEWQKFSKTVTVGDTPYLELAFETGANGSFYMDDLSIHEVAESGIKEVVVKVGDKVSTAAGFVSGPESGEIGAAVEFTATTTEGGKFDGWYKDGTLVSSEATISHNIGEAANYVAQFSFADAATVDADSFEGDTSNWNGLLLGGDLKYAIKEDGLARSGNRYLWGRIPWRVVGRSFDVEPNTTYTVSFYYRTGEASGNDWIYGAYNAPTEASDMTVYAGVRNGGEIHYKEKSGGSMLDRDAYTGTTYENRISTEEAYGKDAWKLYTFNIRTGAEDTALDFAFRAEGWSILNIDDIVVAKADTFDNATTLEKAGEKAAAALEYQGAQIRTTGKQALRFLQYINKDVLGEDKGNYEVVEYGSVVMKGEYLDNDTDLVIGYQGTYGGKLRKSIKAVSYNKDANTNVVFEDNTNTIGFTAAIINIGVKNYASDYAVRSYVIVKDKATGETTTVYGTVDKSNILYVANALKDDATFGESMQQIIADYDAYLAENN